MSACLGPSPTMYHMSTDFGAAISSRFLFRARTNRQTRLNALPTPADMQPAWVINYITLSSATHFVCIFIFRELRRLSEPRFCT